MKGVENELKYVSQMDYDSLSDLEKKEITRYRFLAYHIKKHEENIVKIQHSISKLEHQLNVRKDKISNYKKEQRQIFDKYRRYTNDLIPFRIQLDDKENNRHYYYLMFNVPVIRNGKLVKRTISKYLGTRKKIKKVLNVSSSISESDLQDENKNYVDSYFKHHIQFDFDNFLDKKVNINMNNFINAF